jgi:hypothetical protein
MRQSQEIICVLFLLTWTVFMGIFHLQGRIAKDDLNYEIGVTRENEVLIYRTFNIQGERP